MHIMLTQFPYYEKFRNSPPNLYCGLYEKSNFAYFILKSLEISFQPIPQCTV